MGKRYKNSFANKVLAYISALEVNVILRADIRHLGEARQISRAFNTLIEDGRLIRLGYGVYVKAEWSEYIDAPLITVGFTNACIEALNCLNINWEPGQAIRDYNEGKTQQVPARFAIRLNSRYRGCLRDGKRRLIIEGDVNAR